MKLQKMMIGFFGGLMIVAVFLSIGVVARQELAAKQLEQAIVAGDGIDIYTLYTDGEKDAFIRRRQDAVIARTIDSIHMDLQMQEIEGAEACQIWMNQWGDLLDENSLCLADCLSDENVERWNLLMDDIAVLKLRSTTTGTERQFM